MFIQYFLYTIAGLLLLANILLIVIRYSYLKILELWLKNLKKTFNCIVKLKSDASVEIEEINILLKDLEKLEKSKFRNPSTKKFFWAPKYQKWFDEIKQGAQDLLIEVENYNSAKK